MGHETTPEGIGHYLNDLSCGNGRVNHLALMTLSDSTDKSTVIKLEDRLRLYRTICSWERQVMVILRLKHFGVLDIKQLSYFYFY